MKKLEIPMALQRLVNYPAGTWIMIGERKFYRLALGTFWREDHEIRGNCVSRPSVSIRNIELMSGHRHKIIRR
jgi:hypothetical protein